ncbi:hypothetical protein E2562_003567 [Oryza meyeriana var. granulata]|uniref:Uncharacterized protein n=1 Tax=Oryza meyeriana var. granulata TaxID=110450 RepID=A0A6G1CN70_9ORYZ|nr:hypothetical protein E2562_003567 [Oryza meyeriana var. granulata]
MPAPVGLPGGVAESGRSPAVPCDGCDHAASPALALQPPCPAELAAEPAHPPRVAARAHALRPDRSLEDERQRARRRGPPGLRGDGGRLDGGRRRRISEAALFAAARTAWEHDESRKVSLGPPCEPLISIVTVQGGSTVSTFKKPLTFLFF